jgi:hypothetical protein
LVADCAIAVVLIVDTPFSIEPETILKTLLEALTDESAVAPLSSISLIVLAPFVNCNSQFPGSNFSLYRALFTFIAKISHAL